MRLSSLAILSVLAAPAHAQRGPTNDDGDGKRPYTGPQYPGKPPPLGAPDRGRGASPFADSPRVPPETDRSSARQAGRLPPSDARAASSGTGFVVADGRIMTNNHVVADCDVMVARNAQNVRVVARVLATDARRDLALLSVPNELAPALPFRDAPPVRRGETVVTYGFPLSGLLSSGPTLTTGDISALAGLRDNPLNFQISAPVQPGNSGGAIVGQPGQRDRGCGIQAERSAHRRDDRRGYPAKR